jgi:hypothetical protein
MQLSFSPLSKHGLKPKLTDANLANTIAVVSSAPASGTSGPIDLPLGLSAKVRHRNRRKTAQPKRKNPARHAAKRGVVVKRFSMVSGESGML